MMENLKNNCPNCRQFITRIITEEKPDKTVNVEVKAKLTRTAQVITLEVWPVTRNKTQKQTLRIK